MRYLQKGRTTVAFEREKSTLHRFSARNLPVTPIIAEGPTWLLLPHRGTTLDGVLRNENWSESERLESFEAAGTALANLHAQGASHGRPAIKDICWQEGKITFIDLEYHRTRLDNPKGHARDLIVFALLGLAIGDGPSPAMTRALASYRALDSAGVWTLAQRRCARLRWISWLARPFKMLGPGKAREAKAVSHLFDIFAKN